MKYDVVGNGKRLVLLRGSKPQKEVAASVGITVSALSMYESGNRNPRDDIKCSLAEYYHVPVSVIFYPETSFKMEL